jgi:hypothetical protein
MPSGSSRPRTSNQMGTATYTVILTDPAVDIGEHLSAAADVPSRRRERLIGMPCRRARTQLAGQSSLAPSRPDRVAQARDQLGTGRPRRAPAPGASDSAARRLRAAAPGAARPARHREPCVVISRASQPAPGQVDPESERAQLRLRAGGVGQPLPYVRDGESGWCWRLRRGSDYDTDHVPPVRA